MNQNKSYPQYENHDFVLYQNHEAEVMKTNENNTIEITYPITEFMGRRVRVTVYPSQLQVILMYIKLINLIHSLYFVRYSEKILFVNMTIIVIVVKK